VPEDQTDAAVELLDAHHSGTAVIGKATKEAGIVELPMLGLRGGPRGFETA
jgi:hypothetical protein